MQQSYIKQYLMHCFNMLSVTVCYHPHATALVMYRW